MQISLNGSLFVPENYPDRVNFEKFYFLKIFLQVKRFMILFFLDYDILYLFTLKIYICSNSCSKFVKSCIAPCNAVNLDYVF